MAFQEALWDPLGRHTMGQTASKRPETSLLECIPADYEFDGFNINVQWGTYNIELLKITHNFTTTFIVKMKLQAGRRNEPRKQRTSCR